MTTDPLERIKHMVRVNELMFEGEGVAFGEFGKLGQEAVRLFEGDTPIGVVMDWLTERGYEPTDKATWFNQECPLRAVRVLERARQRGKDGNRIRLHYGEADTGRDWNEEYQVQGYIGRSTGTMKVPVLLTNSRCVSGLGILDGKIIKITTTTDRRRVLYEHSNYVKPVVKFAHNPDRADLRYEVHVDGQIKARFPSHRSRSAWVTRMWGTSFSDHIKRV